MEPVPASELRFSRIAELWAAVSISVLLVVLALMVVFEPANVWAGSVVVVIAFLVGESVLRGTFVRTVNRIAVLLALVGAVVLVVQFWQATVIALLVGFAAFLVMQRLRELRA